MKEMTGVNLNYPEFLISFKRCFTHRFILRLWLPAHYSFSAVRNVVLVCVTNKQVSTSANSFILSYAHDFWTPILSLTALIAHTSKKASKNNYLYILTSKKRFNCIRIQTNPNCIRIQIKMNDTVIDNNEIQVPDIFHSSAQVKDVEDITS